MVPAPPAAVHRRTWPQRLLIACNVMLVLACVAGASGYGWLYQKGRMLPRADIAEGVLAPSVDEPGEPENFLLVGSDSRAFTDGDAALVESFGDSKHEQGQRADTIMLLRVDPRAGTAAVVSFPRDLLVDVPGSGERTRINNTYAEGPEKLIETVKENFRVPVHHYVQVDFAGFKGLVDAIGGVKMYFPNPVRDWKYENGRYLNPSGLDLPAGCLPMNGDQALSYVRSRHFEELIDGKWQADTGSPDMKRIDRQQRFMIRAANQAISDDFLNPVRLKRLLDVVENHVEFDPKLRISDILALGEQFQDFTPDRLQRHVVEVQPLWEGDRYLGEQYSLDDPVNAATFEHFRDQLQPDTATPPEPADVAVSVLNGTGQPGQAGMAGDQLVAAGFSVPLRGDAPALVAETTLRHGPGQVAAAEIVERHLTAGAAIVEDPTLGGAEVVLVTGPDFAGLLDQPRPPAPAPPPEATTTTTTTIDPTTETTLSAAEAERIWNAAVAEGECQ